MAYYGARRALLAAGRAAGFSPAALSPFVWLDPSDLSTLFQDSAGTTPVTAAGDPVGRIDNKGAAGGAAVQATAGKRPIYRAVGGLHWLEFDGVDDGLLLAAVTLPVSMYFALGAEDAVDDANSWLISHGVYYTPEDGFYVFGEQGDSWTIRRTTNHHANGPTRWALGAHVSEFLYTADTGGQLFSDGVELTLSSPGGAALSESDATKDLYLFNEGNFYFYPGDLYGLVIAPLPGATLQAQAQAYLAAKTGVTL